MGKENGIMTWQEMKTKYSEDREHMTEEMERNFVNDCFSCYEEEGFVKKFQSPYVDHKYLTGQKFEVVERCTEKDFDLCVLPMWRIKFADGTVIAAYPEEIIPSEISK